MAAISEPPMPRERIRSHSERARSRVEASRTAITHPPLVLALHALDVPSHGLLCDLPGTDPLPGQCRFNFLQVAPQVVERGPFRDLAVPDRPVQLVLQLLDRQFRPVVLGPVSRDHPFLYAGRIVVAHRYDLP